MASYRLRQSSSRSVPDNPSNKEGEERGTSTRRRRRSRTGRRAKNKLMALVFGFALFGTAGGLLALLAGELGDGIGSEPPAASGKTAGVRAGQGGTVPVVTCPGTDKSTQHPAYAAACGDRAALKRQLARPGAGDAADPRPEFAGRTALHHAAQRGDTDMLADLLAAGANPNQADAAAYTPLHLVATTPQLRHPEFVASRLLDGGARIDLRNARGLTPIEELETHQQRLLEQQNLAKVLFRKQREDQLVQSLTPAIIGDDPSTDTVVEVHTEQGRVRLAVEPAAPAPVIKKP